MRDKVNSVPENNGNSSCAGACPDVSSDAILSLGPENRYSQIPTIRIFLGKYHTYPSSLECDTEGDGIDYHVTTILHYLRDELNHDINKDCIERKYHRLTKQRYVESRLTDLGNGIMIRFDGSRLESEIENPNKLPADHGDDYFLIISEIKIYYLPEHDSFVQDLSDRFSQMTVFSSKSCTLQMVCRNDCGYYLRGIRIKKPLITDLALHYGKNFVGTHEKILKNLNQKESKGIVLLHGVPGSGNLNLSRRYIYIIVFIE
jgi:hypothetical protein